MKKFMFLVLLVILVSCTSAGTPKDLSNGIPRDFRRISYFIVDGMPCMYVDTGYNEGGISCNWSKWDGRIEDGEIFLP